MQLLVVLTPPIMLLCSYIHYSKINDPLSPDFNRKYGSLFQEFKNNKGFLSTQYYLVFFCRRIVYLFTQIYLNSYPYVQTIINIVFSLVQIVHLLYYLPFKEVHILISVIAGEVASVIFITLSISFLGNISDTTSAGLEGVMIYSVIASMVVQILAAGYSFLLSLKEMRKKWLKYKSKVNATANTAKVTLSADLVNNSNLVIDDEANDQYNN